MNKLTFLFILILSVSYSCKKEGCTSHDAVNFDWDADIDDGSCLFWGGWQSDFTPPSGADLSVLDTTSPAYHRIMTASNNNFGWSATGKIISDQAASPDAFLKNDSIFLYYHAWTAGTETDRICLAVSGNNGASWVYKWVSLTGYGAGELTNMKHPDVMLMSDDMIRMYVSAEVSGQWSVLCYESEDGLNFNYLGLAAHSPTDARYDSHTFYFVGSWYQFTINGVDSTHLLSYSTDAVTFTESEGEVFINGGTSQYVSNGHDHDSPYTIITSNPANGNLYAFTTYDVSTWGAIPAPILSFGGSSDEGSYLIDPTILRDSEYNYFMAYSTRIP